jgi:glucose-6-phosphate 1-epimerase
LAGFAGSEFIDQLADHTRQARRTEPVIDRETDHIYPDQPGDVTVTDPDLGRQITIHKTGLHGTVLWNPHIEKSRRLGDLGDEEWTSFLCIESAALGENAIELEPEGSRTLSATIAVA